MCFLANGKLRISGFSLPENSYDLYSKPLNWLRDLKTSDPVPIELDLKFDYLDSSSVRSVADMVKILNNLRDHRFENVRVNWFYERDDDDMKETGADMSQLAKVEFKLIPMDIDDLAI